MEPPSIYIPWQFPPVWGVANNTEETTKQWGFPLRSSGNDEGPSRVVGWHCWSNTAHPPQLMSLHLCHLPY